MFFISNQYNTWHEDNVVDIQHLLPVNSEDYKNHIITVMKHTGCHYLRIWPAGFVELVYGSFSRPTDNEYGVEELLKLIRLKK